MVNVIDPELSHGLLKTTLECNEGISRHKLPSKSSSFQSSVVLNRIWEGVKAMGLNY